MVTRRNRIEQGDDDNDERYDANDNKIILGDGYEQERGELFKSRRGIFPTGGPRGSQESGHCRVSYLLKSSSSQLL